jgi:hypothetical protein
MQFTQDRFQVLALKNIQSRQLHAYRGSLIPIVPKSPNNPGFALDLVIGTGKLQEIIHDFALACWEAYGQQNFHAVQA